VSGRGYLGGGMIAAVCGISPFATPLDAYYAITGERSVDVPEWKREFFERRKAFEPIAIACFERVEKVKVIRTNERYTDPTISHFKAEIDFETEDGNNGETKTVGEYVRDMWGDPTVDEPPMYVTAQAAWGLGIHPAELCRVHALEMDRDRIFYVYRNEEVILFVRDQAMRFWKNHIEPRRPPAPIDAEDILKLYGRGTDRKVEADDEVREALKSLSRVKSLEKIQYAERLRVELIVKKFMRDASALTVDGKVAVTWKADSNGIRKFLQKA
jgi:hypothetical protein